MLGSAVVGTVIAEIPFMSTAFYTGVMVKHLGGADISWLIGLALAAVLYTAAMRPVVRREAAAAARARGNGGDARVGSRETGRAPHGRQGVARGPNRLRYRPCQLGLAA